MGAGSHLGIDLSEYDTRIRTFVPAYDEMLDAAGSVLRRTIGTRGPLIVDLGIGTGALAARSLAARPSSRILGIDADAGMLTAAQTRLGRRVTPVHGRFERIEIPPCDAVTASLALHHLTSRARRLRLFRRIHKALKRGGVLVNADCYIASTRRLRDADRRDWLAHLERVYSAKQAAGYLRAWAREDRYEPLIDEVRSLERAGFTVDIPWRRGAFAVVVATV